MLIILLSIAATAPALAEPRKPEAPGAVVFVCEHGNVKSLMAREWFNRLAAKRGLGVRALSRGLAPEASVPPAIADALLEELEGAKHQ